MSFVSIEVIWIVVECLPLTNVAAPSFLDSHSATAFVSTLEISNPSSPVLAQSPQDTIKIRRLPTEGQRLKLTVEVLRVREAEGNHHGMVTLRIPGALAPVTIPANYLPDADA